MPVFYGKYPNIRMAINRLNVGENSLNAVIDWITGGGGITAPSDMVEAAVQWAIDRATNYYVTYSQTNRNLKNTNGLSFDCSSFIITAFYAAGLDVNATYTGNMRSGFTSVGFTWIPGTTFTANQCQRGDILLNETYHTQMYIGDNQDVNCGSTPARVMYHTDSYPWDGILRYTG